MSQYISEVINHYSLYDYMYWGQYKNDLRMKFIVSPHYQLIAIQDMEKPFTFPSQFNIYFSNPRTQDSVPE